MSAPVDLFAGFAERRIATAAGVRFVRTGGTGPPLLLLHGYPQTHVCWHKIALELAAHFTLVLADLRGYGASSAPAGDAEHATYSKRALAADCLAVMQVLGHRQFFVAGHDRGGRVAYRLALDHPTAVRALVAIDILPTWNVWRLMRADSAIKSCPWAFLAQPHPPPERLNSKDPVCYLEHTLKSWAKPRDLSPFSPAALDHYRALLSDPERVHAVCEDYRAGASIDRDIDDTKAADRLPNPRAVGQRLSGQGCGFAARGLAKLVLQGRWHANRIGRFSARRKSQGDGGGAAGIPQRAGRPVTAASASRSGRQYQSAQVP
jgi:haloacetate dehalogenase